MLLSCCFLLLVVIVLTVIVMTKTVITAHWSCCAPACIASHVVVFTRNRVHDSCERESGAQIRLSIRRFAHGSLKIRARRTLLDPASTSTTGLCSGFESSFRHPGIPPLRFIFRIRIFIRKTQQFPESGIHIAHFSVPTVPAVTSFPHLFANP